MLRALASISRSSAFISSHPPFHIVKDKPTHRTPSFRFVGVASALSRSRPNASAGAPLGVPPCCRCCWLKKAGLARASTGAILFGRVGLLVGLEVCDIVRVLDGE